MSNIVQLNRRVESSAETQKLQKVDLDENLKVIVRALAKQAAKEYFESNQSLGSNCDKVATSSVDSTVKEGV